MKKSYRILLGIATFWWIITDIPVTVMMVSSAKSLQGKHLQALPPEFFVFIIVNTISALSIAGVSIFYAIYVFKGSVVPPEKRSMWLVLVILLGFVTNPVFWYIYIWRDVKPAERRPWDIFCRKCGALNNVNNFKCTSCGSILR